MFLLYSILPPLQEEILNFLGFLAADDDEMMEILQHLDDRRSVDIIHTYFDDFSSLMRDLARETRLRSFYGLVKSVDFGDFSCFIDLQKGKSTNVFLSKILVKIMFKQFFLSFLSYFAPSQLLDSRLLSTASCDRCRIFKSA